MGKIWAIKVVFCIFLLQNLLVTGCASNPGKKSGSAYTIENAKRAFTQYNNYMKEGKYLEAAKFIQKDDLDALKELFIPLLNKMIESNDISLLLIANNLLIGKSTEEINTEEFFSNFISWIMAMQKNAQDILRESEIEIINCYQNKENNTVIIEYLFKHPMIEVKDFDTLIFMDGRWYLKWKQDINQLKSILDNLL